MNITFPSDTKEIIDKIRTVIGRNVDIHYTTSGEVCTTCDVDPITGRSFNPFCPVCSGLGYIENYLTYSGLAHVRWTNVGDSYNSPSGDIDTGNCVVTMEYVETLPAIIDTSDYFLVDDIKLYYIEYDLRGVQEINRIAIKLQQSPREQR